ncbi:hypothetical protein ACFP2F_22905 [Hymenobacter artigasi]|uniref:Yip1 domain-containing protein n=1 Tax=Hymenobacter artigasi TaxID=2719616 RepID=A0ABX1HP65_9BACT|nr:hypothetical protein [Hymenobacter artigasi]NKI92037.1 hypothetical protein [Hymenobacter artigasi]
MAVKILDDFANGLIYRPGFTRQLLPVLALVLALFFLSWLCYVEYAQQHYRGDGFGNLPADAPAFMRQAKELLGWTVLFSLPIYGIFLLALALGFPHSPWPARLAYAFLLLVYPLLALALGLGFILA